MSEHLRAAVADIDARLDALQIEMQRLADAKGVLLKLMGQAPVPVPAPIAPVAASLLRTPTPTTRRRIPKALAKAKAFVPGDRPGRILQALVRAGGPTDLMTIVKITGDSRDNVRLTLARLRKSGQVLATGATLSRRFSLPGHNGRAAAQPPASDTEGDARRGGAHARG